MDGDRGADEHQVEDSQCHQQSIECVFPQLGRVVKWNDTRPFTFLGPKNLYISIPDLGLIHRNIDLIESQQP